MSPASMNFALALIALSAMASIAPASANIFKREPDAYYFDLLPDKSEWSPEALMLDLGRGYSFKRSDYYKRLYGEREEIPGMVYNWLTRTSDKDKPNTILGKYSVKDLLGLNEIYAKQCNIDDLERRRRICNDFQHEKITLDDWQLNSRLNKSPETQLFNQKFLLREYCLATLGYFRRKLTGCLDARVFEKLPKKDLNTLVEFRKAFFEYLRTEKPHMSDELLIKEFAKRYDPKALAKFMKSCPVLDKLDESIHFKQDPDSRWNVMSQYCQYAASS